VLITKIRQPEFVLSASLKTYVFAISKNLWLKRLRGDKSIVFANVNETAFVTENFELEPVISREEKINLWLQKITTHCQRLLKSIFFLEQPMEDLMKKMGWKNKHTAANQQYKCIQQIKKVKEKEA
jgi:DNA-directed RNA polymerase specialized sigma24 family protein